MSLKKNFNIHIFGGGVEEKKTGEGKSLEYIFYGQEKRRRKRREIFGEG